jgi:hypothetical protein
MKTPFRVLLAHPPCPSSTAMQESVQLAPRDSSNPPRFQIYGELKTFNLGYHPSSLLSRTSPGDMSTSRHVTRLQPESHNSATQIPPQSSSSNVKDSRPKTYSRKAQTTSHYLTPPLTPSSSLQSDSAEHEPTDINIPSADLKRLTLTNPGSDNNQHSRFLIVRMSCVICGVMLISCIDWKCTQRCIRRRHRSIF